MMTASADCTLSILILTKNRLEYIRPLLNQLTALVQNPSFTNRLEIIVGDTGTTDPEILNFYKTLSKSIRLKLNLDYHFSKNNNTLSEMAQGSHLLFLNNDILFKDPQASIQNLLKALAINSPRDIFGTTLLFENQTIQHKGIYFSRSRQNWALAYHLGAGEPVDTINTDPHPPAVTGAFLAIQKKHFFELNRFEELYFSECQDVDLCLKSSRLGGKIHLIELDQITHFENGTRTKGETNAFDREYFLRRWKGYIEEKFLLTEEILKK